MPIFVPPCFAVNDESILFDCIEKWSFATLITPGHELWVSHVPLMLDRDRRVLIGHLSVANGHASALGDSTAVFHGPHEYVSPSWYASEGNVPTWNYAVVHASGRAVMIDGAASAVLELSRRFGDLTDYSSGVLDSKVKGIVAFEMSIDSIVGKFKMSQNKSDLDAAGVVEGLRSAGTDVGVEVAEWVERLRG